MGGRIHKTYNRSRICGVFPYFSIQPESTNAAVTVKIGYTPRYTRGGPALDIPKGVEVYEIDGPFFFGLASRFEELENQKRGETKVRIIRMRKVPFIDSTGINNLRNLCERTHKRGVIVILSGVTEKVHQSLVKFGVDLEIGPEYIFPHIVPALKKATEIVSNK